MPLPDPDHPLLTRFARGDTQALADLAARHEPALLGLARGLLSGREELAQDAVQDTWLRVVKYSRSFNGHSTVKTWLYRILINRCKTLRAKRLGMTGSAAERRGTMGALLRHKAALPTTPPDGDPILRTTLDNLPGHSRLILLLCYHHGLTHDQAAEVLGIPIGTLKSRLHAALQTLRAALQTGDKP